MAIHTVQLDVTVPDGARSRDARAATRSTLGKTGERLAERHLARDHGMSVVARNWRLASGELRGELDVVAVDRRAGLVVVCEVKTRRGAGYGGPLAAVGPAKQAKIRRLTASFLLDASLGYRRVRFDVVGLVIAPGTGTLEHVENAF